MPRPDPPLVADEREMLLAWLEYHRATLDAKCQGLTPERLATRAVPPSSLSLLGLVRHMAEVERGWFARCFAGREAPPRFYSDADPDGDFDGARADNAGEGFAAWREECQAARAVVAGAPSLDATVVDPRRGTISLRWIVVHMIEEYARHNGHADLLRQCLDGAVGD